MAKAYQALRPRPDYLLIDVDHEIPPALFYSQGITVEARPQQPAIVKGDRLCLSISAASFLAEVARDELMTKLDAILHERDGMDHMNRPTSYPDVRHEETKP
jgi:ribonuclease HII